MIRTRPLARAQRGAVRGVATADDDDVPLFQAFPLPALGRTPDQIGGNSAPVMGRKSTS